MERESTCRWGRGVLRYRDKEGETEGDIYIDGGGKEGRRILALDGLISM